MKPACFSVMLLMFVFTIDHLNVYLVAQHT